MALHGDFTIFGKTFEVSAGDVGDTSFTATRKQDGELVKPTYTITTNAEDVVLKVKLNGTYATS